MDDEAREREAHEGPARPDEAEHDVELRLLLRPRAEDEPLSGRLLGSSGVAREFTGWVALAGLIERAALPGGSGGEPPGRA